ncbi:dihydroxyacetone kinase family protein [Streptomyces sp. NPDC000880]
MTYLYNNPADFADELVQGFVAANRQLVRRVPGGVVRTGRTKPGHVSIVIGGGSGHYPAFAGLVGPGLAHGAAMGNLFASPSAQHVYNVAKATEAGGGILLTYGNYAGDVLNFDQAQSRLRQEGIACSTVVVTDDVSSASRDEFAKRRGIAGDLCVFKVAAAAAESGADLDEVTRLAARANDRTRSFGVAFSGCTLPGADAPLFTVPAGRMGIGMGIHGEPGIDEADIPSADELAALMTDKVLAEAPADAPAAGGRVAVILNGLGSVKYEELFVLYGRVAQLLEAKGLTVVEPEVGELVTSFQMAGVSLTLCWLDDELEPLWSAPAYTPAYRKGSVTDTPGELSDTEYMPVEEVVAEASAESRAAAAVLAEVLSAARATIDEHADELGRMDAVAGDGDHGIGMRAGVTAAVSAAGEVLGKGAGAGTLLTAAGNAWAERAGGTSGALWGIALRAVGAAFGDTAAPDARTVAAGVREAQRQISAFGKAQPGDKTLLDTLLPFADALETAAEVGDDLVTAWGTASAEAERAARATASLVPKIGRARPHAEKSVGTPDPGAVSMALVFDAVHRSLLKARYQHD